MQSETPMIPPNPALFRKPHRSVWLALIPAVTLLGLLARRGRTVDMAPVAMAFLTSLTPDLRDQAVFPFQDAERLNWHFVPRARRGVSLKQMNEAQRDAARALLRAGLSQRGYLK